MVSERRPRGSSLVRDAQGCKQCVSCMGWLTESKFYKSKTSLDGLVSRCNRCRNLWAYYRLLPSDIERMLFDQNGLCKLCEVVLGDKYNVDHDHNCCSTRPVCGKCIRGLLCYNCNVGLGNLKDDPALLLRAIHYLEGNL